MAASGRAVTENRVTRLCLYYEKSAVILVPIVTASCSECIFLKVSLTGYAGVASSPPVALLRDRRKLARPLLFLAGLTLRKYILCADLVIAGSRRCCSIAMGRDPVPVPGSDKF